MKCKTKLFTFEIPVSLHDRVKSKSDELGIPMRLFTEKALKYLLDSESDWKKVFGIGTR